MFVKYIFHALKVERVEEIDIKNKLMLLRKYDSTLEGINRLWEFFQIVFVKNKIKEFREINLLYI